jgi:hypothetical protein
VGRLAREALGRAGRWERGERLNWLRPPYRFGRGAQPGVFTVAALSISTEEEVVTLGETLTNVSRANLKDDSIEEPNEESGAYAFFDWKGERCRASFSHFEEITKPLEQYKSRTATPRE